MRRNERLICRARVALTRCRVCCFDCLSSNISPSKSVATAKVMRKAKMVMSIARMGGNSSDIASSNPVFQLLNEGADAKQDVRLP